MVIEKKVVTSAVQKACKRLLLSAFVEICSLSESASFPISYNLLPRTVSWRQTTYLVSPDTTQLTPAKGKLICLKEL